MSAPPLRHLYPRLTSFASLQAAAHRAQRGKRYRPAVLAFTPTWKPSCWACRRSCAACPIGQAPTASSASATTSRG